MTTGGEARAPGIGDAASWPIEPDATRVNVTLRHLGLATIAGRFCRFSGVLSADHAMVVHHLELVIEAGSIETGEQRRDRHLNAARVFGSDEHPALNVRSTWARPLSRGQYRIDAMLTMHGSMHYVALDGGVGAFSDRADGRRLYSVRLEGGIDRRRWSARAHATLEELGLLIGHEVHLDFELAALAAPATLAGDPA